MQVFVIKLRKVAYFKAKIFKHKIGIVLKLHTNFFKIIFEVEFRSKQAILISL